MQTDEIRIALDWFPVEVEEFFNVQSLRKCRIHAKICAFGGAHHQNLQIPACSKFMKPNFCTIIVDIASFEVLLLLPALIMANSVIATPCASGKRTPRPSARIREIEQS